MPHRCKVVYRVGSSSLFSGGSLGPVWVSLGALGPIWVLSGSQWVFPRVLAGSGRVLFRSLVVRPLPLKRGREGGELPEFRLLPVAVLGGVGMCLLVPFVCPSGPLGAPPGGLLGLLA